MSTKGSTSSGYDAEDLGYIRDPKFWEEIERRRAESAMVTLEDVEAMIARQEAAESRKGSPPEGREKESK